MKKKILTLIGIVLGFIVISYAFVPEVLSGKILNQSDFDGWKGMAQEKRAWDKAHPDDPALWTDSMFGGMPTVTIIGSNKGDWFKPVYDFLMTGARPANFYFVSLLGAFLLMLAFGINPWIAAGGAVAVTFCSYNIQIVQVGHNTKMQALAFLPWVLAALVFTYRKALDEGLGKRRKWACILIGAALFGLAVSLQVKAFHPQISYYLAIMIIFYALVLLISLFVQKKPQKYFWIASVLMVLTGVIGLGTNATHLLPTMEYTPYTMRGGAVAEDGGDAGSGGLDLAYATAWSYGWNELPNMLIPNYNGGASSGPLSMDSETVQLLRRAGQPNLAQVRKNLPTYWGPQPFTAGPMYMGAITIFLFIFGLCYWKGKEKWWAVSVSLLAIFLAVGNHMMWFTRFFHDYVPLYDKFRTVSMALVVLQFALPVLGFLMLDKVVKDASLSGKPLRKEILTAGGITLGLTLFLALLQGMFGSFTGGSDYAQPEVLVDALAADRVGLLWKDTLRSLLLVAASVALLLWGSAKDGRKLLSAGLVCVLVLVDLFAAGRRYLGPDNFKNPAPGGYSAKFEPRLVDEEILLDEDQSYRVLDLSEDVFNSSLSSYWHKSIGGYSPAKLQRYQSYIDKELNGELRQVASAISGCATVDEAEQALPYLEGLASLNCRYIIIQEDIVPLRYGYARGNAWFEDGEGSVELLEYTPNRLTYSYSRSTDGLAVFSEIYYPTGWVARLEDGSTLPVSLYGGGEDELGKVAGGLLRCIDLPSGNHTLTMSYEPESYAKGAAASTASSILLILLLLGGLALTLSGRKKA